MSTIQDLLESIYPEHRPDTASEWKIPCLNPDCPCQDPTHTHLQVNPLKEVGFCFRCSTTFTAIDLISVCYGVSRETARTMWKGAGVERIRKLQAKLKAIQSKLQTLQDTEHDVAVMLPDAMTPNLQDAAEYLAKRNLTLAQAARLGFGYCPKGYWRSRLIIPIYIQDRVFSFMGRALWGPPEHFSELQKEKWVSKTRYKKVLFPAGFSSKRTLYNPARFMDGSEDAILVEGDFDAISVGAKAFAQFGLTVSEYQLALLRDYGKTRVCVLYDYGEHEATSKSVELCLKFGFDTYSAQCVQGKDPGDMSKLEIKAALKAARRHSLVRSGLLRR